MKLWLDDVRTPPDDTWTWAKTFEGAVELFNTEPVVEISFDHDLGDTNRTGYTLALLIERLAHEGVMGRIKWRIHSANPVGKRNIQRAMESADKVWKEQEDGA